MEKKTSMFKIVSIIMMIGGIAATVGYIVTAGAVAAVMSNSLTRAEFMLRVGRDLNSGLFWFGLVVALIASVIEIIAGALGMKNWNDTSKAQLFMIFGGAVAALQLLANILISVAYEFNFFSILSGLAIPVLYWTAVLFCILDFAVLAFIFLTTLFQAICRQYP